MTVITPDTLLGLAQAQTALTRLAIGSKMIADIVGPTRHGLAVRVGDGEFLLNTKTALPDANHLTLKVSGRTSTGAHEVQVLAADDRVLNKPIPGDLISKVPTPAAPVAAAASSTVAEEHQIEVNARPVTHDGKVLGPAVTIRLATKATSRALEAVQPSSRAAAANQPQAAGQRSPVTVEISIKPAPSGMPPVPDAVQSPPPPTVDGGQGRRLTSPIAPSDPTLKVGLEAGSARPLSSPQTSHMETEVRNNPVLRMVPTSNKQDVMVATVVARAPDSGQVILQVADDLLLKVDQPIDLPVGTSLQMTLATGSVNSSQPWGHRLPPANANPLTKLIELLEDIGKVGQQEGKDPEPATGRRLPMPDRHLAAKLLQLIDLQMPSSADETGVTARDQDVANPSKTHQLQSLLSDISNTASDQLAEGWRSATLPLGTDPAQAVMIYHREHNPDTEAGEHATDADDGMAQRAIFDINFSRLGRCQIDALCQEQRFDLQMRSEKPLDHAHQLAITDLFTSACEIAGLKGEIGYRHGQFIEPAKTSTATTTVTT